MFLLLLTFLAVQIPAAEKAPVNPYAGWKYAAEIVIDNPDPFDRPNQIIDASIALPLERCGNTPNDLRTVTKRAFDTLDREIPCQAYAIGRTDKFKTFRLAFRIDLPQNGQRRVALFYDNPKAKIAEAKGRPFSFKEVPGLSSGPENLCRITLAHDSALKVAPLDALSPSRGPENDTLLTGPVFSAIRGTRFFLTGKGDTLARLNFGVTAYAAPPLFVVSSRLTFQKNASLFEIRNAALTFPRPEYTHYLFRPVTPTLPLTDVEEIGVVLLDSARRASYTEGFDLMAGMLKPDLAWQGLMHMEKKRALNSFELDRSSTGPIYRSAKRAILDSARIELFDSPLFVKRRNAAALAVAVQKGAEYQETIALYGSEWNADAWRRMADGVGRNCNKPVRIAVYPKYGDEPITPPVFPLPYGKRADAYNRGVR